MTDEEEPGGQGTVSMDTEAHEAADGQGTVVMNSDAGASGTVVMDTERASGPGAPPVTLTLEQYAALRAEIVVHPTRRASIFARWGLEDADAFDALEAWWRRQLVVDDEGQLRLETLQAQFAANLRQKR